MKTPVPALSHRVRRLLAWVLIPLVRVFRPGWGRRFLSPELFGLDGYHAPVIADLPVGYRLVVVAPHPDDESIGSGGLLARWHAAGRAAEVIFLTGGEAGDRHLRSRALSDADRHRLMVRTRATRREEAASALSILGASGTWLDGTDGELWRDHDRMVADLSCRWRDAPPDLLVVPFPGDRHADHAATTRIACNAAMAAGLPGALPIWCYEVWSPCPANAVLDIGDVMSLKDAAIAAHASQTATTDYRAAAEALNRYRGISAGLGKRPAEAFWRAPLRDVARLCDLLKV